MLKELRIKNFAIIDQVEVCFGSGLNIISGETGAGKSILMDALHLILGGRASSDIIRQGTNEAIVEASFDLTGDTAVHALLESFGIPLDAQEQELIVRRQLQSSGKNRILINGALVNATTLESITTRLVDLCSQHDQQLLARPDEQLLVLDRFGALEQIREDVAVAYRQYAGAKNILAGLNSDATQRSQRIDFLRFQLQELQEANLENAQEDQDLEVELKTLANAEQLFSLATEADAALNGSEGELTPSILSVVENLLGKTQSLQLLDPRLAPLAENLSSLRIYGQEAAQFVRDYSQRVQHNEGRLEEIHTRLATLSKLKRKYGPALSDVFATQTKLAVELNSLENHDQSLAEAQSAVDNHLAKLEKLSQELHKRRKKAGTILADAVVKELADLQMDRARFSVELSPLDIPGPSGLDQARFLIAANPGESLGLLQKVASGGELSRVMLAIHNVISKQGGVEVYLFDEVDAGIGGKTAAAVGAKIAKVATGHQVICITHLAQVAAFADHHLRVEKQVKRSPQGERTFTSVIPLATEKDRLQELARMLSGMETDSSALANAKALVAKAKQAGQLTAPPTRGKSKARA